VKVINGSLKLCLSLLAFPLLSFGADINDTSKWQSYEVRYEGGQVRLKVPPGHRYRDDASLRTIALGRPGKVEQIFSAQYDFGWRPMWNLSRFEVHYTLVWLLEPFSINAPLADVKPLLLRSLREGLGFSTAAETMQFKVEELESGSWLHFTDKTDLDGEFYAKRCGNEFVLMVTPVYKRGIKSTTWLKEKQAILKAMVGSVRC
jgi:hypothetical protein